MFVSPTDKANWKLLVIMWPILPKWKQKMRLIYLFIRGIVTHSVGG